MMKPNLFTIQEAEAKLSLTDLVTLFDTGGTVPFANIKYRGCIIDEYFYFCFI